MYLLLTSLVMCFTVYLPGIQLRAASVIILFGICGVAVGISLFGLQNYNGSINAGCVPLLLIAIAAGGITGGIIRYTMAAGKPYTGIAAEQVVRITGKCDADSSPVSSENEVVQVKLHRVEDGGGKAASASGTVTVFVSGETPLYWGEQVVLDGNFFNPSGSASDELLFFASLPEGAGKTFSHPLFQIRSQAVQGIRKRIRGYEAQSGPLFEALFLGIKDDLGTLEADLFRKAGCMHILALSGMHLGIISALLFLILRPLSGRRGTFIVVSVILAVYIALTGFRSALVRAGLMFFLFGISKMSGRKGDIRTVFLASFLILSVLTPRALSTLSFQLSFLALGGILFLAPSIHSLWKSYVPGIVSLPVSASLAAQTATAPVVAAAFGTIYPAGILGSMIITPLITLFLSGGIIALVLPFPGIGAALFSMLDYLHSGILYLLQAVSIIPALSFSSPNILSVLWIGTALCIIIPALKALRYRKQFRMMLLHGTY